MIQPMQGDSIKSLCTKNSPFGVWFSEIFGSCCAGIHVNQHEMALHKVMNHQCDYSLLDILSFSMFNQTTCGLNFTLYKIVLCISHEKIPPKIHRKTGFKPIR